MLENCPTFPSSRRPRLYLVLTLLLLLISGLSSALASELGKEQFSVILVNADDEQGAQLAIRWTGDPTARLSAWTDFDGHGNKVQLLDQALLDEGMKLFSVQLTPGIQSLRSATIPLSFQLFQEDKMSQAWEEPVEWLRPSPLSSSPFAQSTERSEKVEGTCEWADGFHVDGFSGEVLALVVFDDGTGSALYVGGAFRTAGPTILNYIGKWDGTSWSSLGVGMDDRVNSLTVYDDGSGPMLVAGGRFKTAGGIAANHVAQWDGISWSPLGAGMNHTVYALMVFDSGTGPVLVAGGDFTMAGGIAANRIAQWDGASWSPLGAGMNSSVLSLTVYDDGRSGPVLVAGGYFTMAGGIAANRISQWDGTSWSTLGGGVDNPVLTLAVYDNGNGSVLVAGGQFTMAGGVAVSHIAQWDGANWSPLGPGTNNRVRALTVYDSGSGPVLIAGGSFTMAGGITANRIAQWNGASWSSLGTGVDESVSYLTTYDGVNGPVLVAGGFFTTADGVAANRIAQWNGTSWAAWAGPSGHANGFDNPLLALTVYDDGSVPMLVAAGWFTTADGVVMNRISQWDGTNWSPLGAGVNDELLALTVYDDGSGPVLVASGDLTSAGEVEADGIAQWNGTSWSPLGSGVTSRAYALTVYDDGSGPALVAGGAFTTAGGIAANRIAQWNGTSWSPLGTGVDNLVYALTVYDNGSGPVLVAGGSFTMAGGITANHIAQWDGTNWSPLGPGMNNRVSALTVYDSGSGPVLIAGGSFTMAGGITANRIAQWDGTSWLPLGAGVSGGVGVNGRVRTLTVYDDGNGPTLVASGLFTTAGEGPANNIAQWNGTGWSALGVGIHCCVEALAVYDDGNGPMLVAGGDFEIAGHKASSNIAVYSCTPDPVLDIPDDIPAATGQSVTVPVNLDTDGGSLASTGLSIDFDESCLTFDPTDGNIDGVPDAITFQGPAGYEIFAVYDAADTDGEIDISVFDSSPSNPLLDGTLLTVDFGVTCTPPMGETQSVPVRFSTDPSPTFGDLEAQDIIGTSTDGSVLIYGGPRGDCNGSGTLGSADLTATELEIFDADGTFWGDTLGSTFAGQPIGCDSNADTAVDAGDLSCSFRLQFGQTCEAPMTRMDGLEPPVLEITPRAQVGDRVVTRLSLQTQGWDANSLVLSLDFDTERFGFDTTDANSDGLPDAVRLPGFVPARVDATWDAEDTDGELDLVLTQPGLAPTTAFPDLVVMEVEVQSRVGATGQVPQPFRLSTGPSPSLGDVYGRSLELQISTPEFGLFMDGFESGDTRAWTSHQ